VPRQPVVVGADPDDREELVAVMREVDAAGRGWINLSPDVDPADLPPAPGPFRLFSAVGPPVPLCTWTPPDRRKAAPHALIGIQHGRGTRVAGPLAEVGITIPDSWRVVQDQPKKGLVVAVPAGAELDGVLQWLFRAGAALCPLPYSMWVAAIYR
jgi:hypothetical protein